MLDGVGPISYQLSNAEHENFTVLISLVLIKEVVWSVKESSANQGSCVICEGIKESLRLMGNTSANDVKQKSAQSTES